MLEGHAWAIAEVPKISPMLKPAQISGTDIACDPPDIVTQHTDPRREFIVLNAQVRVCIMTLADLVYFKYL